MSQLIVRKDTGELLFDTSKITYGLVRSGNLSFVGYWSRKLIKSNQLDPDNGRNWTESAFNTTGNGDGIWGCTISNAQSPIVFLVGSGTLNGTAKNGGSLTFYYSNASTDTKFYCFDLMGDSISGGPYLKTYTDTGVLTFNSLQPPLNVLGTYQAPPPPAPVNNRYLIAYVGGRSVRRQYEVALQPAQMDCVVDINISAGIEYAAFLPWSRGAGYLDTNTRGNGSGVPRQYGVVEGAYGRVGGISFMFGASAATTEANGPTLTQASWSAIPTVFYPQALVITTANLPFPYN